MTSKQEEITPFPRQEVNKVFRDTIERYQELLQRINGRHDGSNKTIANGIYPPPTHTTPVIYYPNHPVYDLGLPQGSLNRVGDNVDPKQGKLDND